MTSIALCVLLLAFQGERIDSEGVQNSNNPKSWVAELRVLPNALSETLKSLKILDVTVCTLPESFRPEGRAIRVRAFLAKASYQVLTEKLAGCGYTVLITKAGGVRTFESKGEWMYLVKGLETDSREGLSAYPNDCPGLSNAEILNKASEVRDESTFDIALTIDLVPKKS
jgi:hypothetical protein